MWYVWSNIFFFIICFLGFLIERWEMEIVVSKFECDGLIDYKEFVNLFKDKKLVSIIFY